MKVEGNNGMEKGIKDEQKGKERIMVGGCDRAQKSQSAHTCMKHIIFTINICQFKQCTFEKFVGTLRDIERKEEQNNGDRKV